MITFGLPLGSTKVLRFKNLGLSGAQQNIFFKLLERFQFSLNKESKSNKRNTSYDFVAIENGHAVFLHPISGTQFTLPVKIGRSAELVQVPSPIFENTTRCRDTITRMIQSHCMDHDMILVGPKASSKSMCIDEFAKILGYELLSMHLYKDMTTRDFLQKRNTRDDGSTYWQDSQLIKAAKQGDLCVLEGVHWVPAQVLAGLGRLLQDREIVLPDNSRLVNVITYQDIKQNTGMSDQQLRQKHIYCVHPAFRVIATATVEKASTQEWFNEEIGGLFWYLRVDEMSTEEEKLLFSKLSQCPDEKMDRIFEFVTQFRKIANAPGHESLLSKSISLSSRQLLRICRRASFGNSDLYSMIHNTTLSPFLPSIAKNALNELLHDVGIHKQVQHVEYYC